MPSMSLTQRLSRKTQRLAKISRQRWSRMGQAADVSTRAVFVFGAQRSGSRLPMQVMERSPDILTYSEGHSRAFNGVLLKQRETLATLLGQSPFPVVAFKPICESHRAVELLDMFPGARALWIFRHFNDVTHSAAVKWGHGRRNLAQLVTGQIAADDWRAGGMTPEKLDLIRQLYQDDMSTYAAHALMWYLRNTLFFDLHLHQNPQVLLVKYEDLVTSPQEHFAQAFQFLSCPFDPEYVAGVYNTSLRPHRAMDIPDDIATLCTELHQRLDYDHVSRSGTQTE